MGWPWGNDQDVFHAHAIFEFRDNLYSKFEANYWLKGKGSLKDDWYADGRPDLDHAPYWPEDPDKIISFILAAQYRPWYWMTWDIYLRPAWVNLKPDHSMHVFLRLDIPGRWEVDLGLKPDAAENKYDVNN
ncbi:MAG: hypothetical protein GF398_10725 [Chitinivibrionales bacterium]|nr:hypothetical protein [Chitinivibrionales bacterium]